MTASNSLSAILDGSAGLIRSFVRSFVCSLLKAELAKDHKHKARVFKEETKHAEQMMKGAWAT